MGVEAHSCEKQATKLPSVTAKITRLEKHSSAMHSRDKKSGDCKSVALRKLNYRGFTTAQRGAITRDSPGASWGISL